MLCRYIARPPVSTQRLSRLDDGRLLYRLKKSWRDGTTHVVFEPIELVEKLVAIVPPPRMHVIRYHGALAPRFRRRREIVAAARRAANPANNTPAAARVSHHGDCKRAKSQPSSAKRAIEREGRQWIPWAELMRRVFAVDVLECPRCKGSMRIIKAVFPPDDTRPLLDSLALPARASPLVPSRVSESEAPPVDWK